MPKTKQKVENIPFNVEKDIIAGTAVEGAPLVGGEFITEDGDWQGQTVEATSDKHLEDDHGTGEHVILRTYQFLANPLAFSNHTPSVQDIFESHRNGITALLWQDGLTPRLDIPPQFVLAKDKKSYLFIVASTPSVGQSVLETSKTLSEIINETRTNTH